MKILTALTYYRPHYSGLTIYAERLALALAQRGHRVTVLTSRYDRSLPSKEQQNGVQVVRMNVRLRISKGVLAPSILWQAWKYAKQADVIHVHLPQLDAAYLAIVGRLLHKPVIVTYHCDLHLPPGPVHWIANQVSHLANYITIKAADHIVTNTRDYAENSPFLRNYLNKLHPVLPPAEVAAVTPADLEAFRQKTQIRPGQRVIGMAARLASEKGVEYLAQAMPAVLQRFPTARVLFVGQHRNVFGEEAYARQLEPLISALGEHWMFLGNLPAVEWAAFFHTCEVTVLPSLNSTESFGMVQVESMLCGTPVVASDLPGVRQPVIMLGMGELVPPGDADALAQALIQVLEQPGAYRCDPELIQQRFSPQAIARAYEAVFERRLHPDTVPITHRADPLTRRDVDER